MICPVQARPVTNGHHVEKEYMMPLYNGSAVERAMKIQEVILRAMSGEITWIKARKSKQVIYLCDLRASVVIFLIPVT